MKYYEFEGAVYEKTNSTIIKNVISGDNCILPEELLKECANSILFDTGICKIIVSQRTESGCTKYGLGYDLTEYIRFNYPSDTYIDHIDREADVFIKNMLDLLRTHTTQCYALKFDIIVKFQHAEIDFYFNEDPPIRVDIWNTQKLFSYCVPSSDGKDLQKGYFYPERHNVEGIPTNDFSDFLPEYTKQFFNRVFV